MIRTEKKIEKAERKIEEMETKIYIERRFKITGVNLFLIV